MTSPEISAEPAGQRPAAAVCLERLRQRRDFVALDRARRQGTGSMLVQGRDRGNGGATIRVGFTCSRKIGNAVIRNRARRRLRALAREVLPGLGRPGWDYALIGRPGATVERGFDDLRADLVHALKTLHRDP